MELCLCCPWLKSLPQLSLSLIAALPPPPLCVVFLSSVHIGGPQNAVCSLAGYLFLLMSFITDEYADVLILGYVVYTLC